MEEVIRMEGKIATKEELVKWMNRYREDHIKDHNKLVDIKRILNGDEILEWRGDSEEKERVSKKIKGE